MKYNKLITTLIALSFTAIAVTAGTMQDCKEVQTIIQKECGKINKSCKIYIDTTDDAINAHTYSGYKIIYSKGIVESFNKYELLAVALHEVGHIKAGDIELLNKIYTSTPNLLRHKGLRHSMEYRADSYATRYFGDNCMDNYMSNTLLKLNRNIHTETDTHPSIENRINNANKVYKNKCKG